MGLSLITPPAAPVSLAEVKRDLRITHTDHDTVLGDYIALAASEFEPRDGYAGRAFMPQTWELTLDAFPDSEIRLSHPPVQSVTSIKYDDVDGAEQTIAAEDYSLDKSSPWSAWVLPAVSWPAPLSAINAVRVRYVAGFADAADVPSAVKQAIRLKVRQQYTGEDTAKQVTELLSRVRAFT